MDFATYEAAGRKWQEAERKAKGSEGWRPGHPLLRGGRRYPSARLSEVLRPAQPHGSLGPLAVGLGPGHGPAAWRPPGGRQISTGEKGGGRPDSALAGSPRASPRKLGAANCMLVFWSRRAFEAECGFPVTEFPTLSVASGLPPAHVEADSAGAGPCEPDVRDLRSLTCRLMACRGTKDLAWQTSARLVQSIGSGPRGRHLRKPHKIRADCWHQK